MTRIPGTIDVRLIDMRWQMIDRGKGRYSRKANGYKTIGRAWHHTAVMTMRGDATEAEERNHVKMIDRYHYDMGWGGFGYNGIIFPSGRAYWCGDWDGARAHVSSRNHELDGICFAGLFIGGAEPTDAALAGARILRDLSIDAHGELPEAGHGTFALPDFPSACPGDRLGRAWIPKIRTAGQEVEVPTQDEYNELVKQVEALEGRNIDLIRFQGTDSIFKVMGHILVEVSGWGEYQDQGGKRVVVMRGTPEYKRYTEGYGIWFKQMPKELLKQTRVKDD